METHTEEVSPELRFLDMTGSEDLRKGLAGQLDAYTVWLTN